MSPTYHLFSSLGVTADNSFLALFINSDFAKLTVRGFDQLFYFFRTKSRLPLPHSSWYFWGWGWLLSLLRVRSIFRASISFLAGCCTAHVPLLQRSKGQQQAGLRTELELKEKREKEKVCCSRTCTHATCGVSCVCVGLRPTLLPRSNISLQSSLQ